MQSGDTGWLNISKAHYFISDTHFGDNLKREKLFIDFLEKIKSCAESLFLLGDLFEFWFEYKETILRRYFPLLSSFSSLSKAGIKFYYLQGNHDFSTDDFLRELGIKVLKSPATLSIDGKKTLLAHGDEFSTNLISSSLKKILHRPYSIRLYSLLHPDISVPLALRIAKLSRKKETHLRKRDWLEPTARRMINAGYDLAIFGHTHMPVLKRFNRGWYLNLGDWLNHFSYGVIEKGTPYLKYFHKGLTSPSLSLS